jgi:hypothetical protein
MSTDHLLTTQEQALIETLGHVWNELCQIVAAGPTRQADLAEAMSHIHALQHTVMAQAAARAFPDRYRVLGQTL